MPGGALSSGSSGSRVLARLPSCQLSGRRVSPARLANAGGRRPLRGAEAGRRSGKEWRDERQGRGQAWGQWSGARAWWCASAKLRGGGLCRVTGGCDSPKESARGYAQNAAGHSVHSRCVCQVARQRYRAANAMFSPCCGPPPRSAQQWQPLLERPGQPWRPAGRCLRAAKSGHCSRQWVRWWQDSRWQRHAIQLAACHARHATPCSSAVHAGANPLLSGTLYNKQTTAALTPGGGDSRQHETANALQAGQGKSNTCAVRSKLLVMEDGQ